MTLQLVDILLVVSTLSIWSVLYKENPFSVWAENTFVGMAQAVAFVIAIDYIKDYTITPMQNGNYLPIIPVLLGLMTYFRYSKRYRFLARLPISISMGVGMGVSLRVLLERSFLTHIRATIVPLFVGGDLLTSFGNIVIVVSLVSTIFFFYFSKPHTGVLGATTRISYYLLYIAFGVYFGNVFMGRVGLFNGRMTQLLSPERMPVTIVAGLAILIITAILSSKGLIKKSIGYSE